MRGQSCLAERLLASETEFYFMKSARILALVTASAKCFLTHPIRISDRVVAEILNGSPQFPWEYTGILF
jgi:hypothetical protein